MAIINEIIVLGRRKRRLINKETKLWEVLSEWTHASDVEFNDGKTAEDKVGRINGITSDFNVGKNDIAASSYLTKSIKEDVKTIKKNLDEGKLNDRIQFVIQEDGTLAWKKDGADAVIPFNSAKCKEGDILAWVYGAVEGWEFSYAGGCNYVGVISAGYKSITISLGECTSLSIDGTPVSNGRYYFKNSMESHILRASSTVYRPNSAGAGFSLKVVGHLD